MWQEKLHSSFSQMANSNSEFSFEHEEDFDLSDTERKIIAQIGHGYSNKEIAKNLDLVRVRFATI